MHRDDRSNEKSISHNGISHRFYPSDDVLLDEYTQSRSIPEERANEGIAIASRDRNREMSMQRRCIVSPLESFYLNK